MRQSAEGWGGSVAEATARALAELGVSEQEAEVEVLNEGRRGVFGSGRRAHVRVRLPAGSPAGTTDDDRRERDDGRVEEDAVGDTEATSETAASEPVNTTETDESSAPEDESGRPADDRATEGTEFAGPPAANEDSESSPEPHGEPEQDGEGEELTVEERLNQLDEEAEMAADFLEGLLDELDLPGDIEIEVQEDQAFVNITEVGSGLLIGRRGATLDALQELTRCAVQRQTERRTHVRVDVEGYRARQLEKLESKCRDAIAEVRERGEPARLEPMDAYERKMMHDLVARTGGVTSSSEGSEPRRRVVVHPE